MEADLIADILIAGLKAYPTIAATMSAAKQEEIQQLLAEATARSNQVADDLRAIRPDPV